MSAADDLAPVRRAFTALCGRTRSADKLVDKIDLLEFDGLGTRSEYAALAYLRGFAEGLGVTLVELFEEVRP